MDSIKERYIVDKDGHEVEVILDIDDYRRIIEEFEMLKKEYEIAIQEIKILRSNDIRSVIEMPKSRFKSIKEARGFLKGIDTNIEREPDRM